MPFVEKKSRFYNVYHAGTNHEKVLRKNNSIIVRSFVEITNTVSFLWRPGGVIVRTLVRGSSGLGSSPGRGHCVVFFASPHASV